MVKKLRSEFTIFCFRPCLIHYKSSIRGSKINCLFLVLQAFIFTVKNILFSGWKGPEFFEVRQKSDDKEVKITRPRSVKGGLRFGRQMTPDKKNI